MVSGAEKKKRRAAAAAAAEANVALPYTSVDPPKHSTFASPASVNIPSNTTSAVSMLPHPFDKFVSRIDPTLLIELYFDLGVLYKELDKEKHEKSWHEGYLVRLDLGKVEGRKEGATQMRREVRDEVQDDMRRERMRRKCEIATQTEPLPLPPLSSTIPPPAPQSQLQFNWAEDVDTVLSSQPPPIIPLATAPRDLSSLRPSNGSKPFGSLQKRNRRAHCRFRDTIFPSSQDRRMASGRSRRESLRRIHHDNARPFTPIYF
ncbi:unnamed protein product [Peniophora sp. CBMAI 1063]|nr:unnamed protein product [Peniophora sp. CBMAI 1063]